VSAGGRGLLLAVLRDSALELVLLAAITVLMLAAIVGFLFG